VISADALAGPGLLALLIALPICSVLAGLGRRGAVFALATLALLVLANIQIANNVSEFGELGAGLTAALAFFGLILVFVSWHVGGFLRDRARAKHARLRSG
jgi:hypothetical protein